jgi:hypothetical protein
LDSLEDVNTAAIQLETFTVAQIIRNTIQRHQAYGIRVGWAGATIDSNLIADNGRGGILLLAQATGRLNSIRRNGIGIEDSVGTGSTFASNNIEGNGFGVMNWGTTVLNADTSWWGDTLGPSCDTLLGCDPSSTGDSVSANVSFADFAADTIAGSPAGAPPALAAGFRSVPKLDVEMQLPAERYPRMPDGTLVPPEDTLSVAGGAGIEGQGVAVRAAGVEQPTPIAPQFRRPSRRGSRR